MKQKNLIILGAGGHANSCTEVIKSTKKFKIIGYIDNNVINNYNFKILGNDSHIKKLKKNYKNYFKSSFKLRVQGGNCRCL